MYQPTIKAERGASGAFGGRLDTVVSVLFARRDSYYKTLPGVEVYDADRDALTWPGGGPVVAHPPSVRELADYTGGTVCTVTDMNHQTQKNAEIGNAAGGPLQPVVMPRPPVIVLCGSSRFVDMMAVTAWLLEREEGAITMGLHLLPWWYSEQEIPDHLAEHEGVAEAMDELHKRKIDLADSIFVINHQDYVGASTLSEINYAKERGIPIRWFAQDAIGGQVRDLMNAAIERHAASVEA